MAVAQDEMSIPMSMFTALLSHSLLRDLYARMLLTRLVDEGILRLHSSGYGDFVASCRGHEAVQVATALCIEVGKDFTLPYYRDLGVVLTIGMTPYEIFRTYITQTQHEPERSHVLQEPTRPPIPHWGYHKHNTVTGPAPVATQILHAAGIAFASKLRKAPVVTVAYCGDGAICEPDFLEGIRFAAQHQLPVVFICEQDCTNAATTLLTSLRPPSCLQDIALPPDLTYQRIDGSDVSLVYNVMCEAMQHTREGHGPVLLEMYVSRSASMPFDPLAYCQQLLEQQEAWDEQWANELHTHVSHEVENALRNALEERM